MIQAPVRRVRRSCGRLRKATRRAGLRTCPQPDCSARRSNMRRHLYSFHQVIYDELDYVSITGHLYPVS
jgi:hypothetical protein